MPKGSFDLTEEVGRMALLEGLDADLLAGVVRTSVVREVRKGERIYWQGDRPQAFYYLVSGHVRRAISSSEGDEKVIDILTPGQYLSLGELFGEAPYESFAEAVEPVVLVQVARDGLVNAMAGSGFLSLRILGLIAERQAAFERHVASCSFQSGCRRLLEYLMQGAGSDLTPSGEAVVHLPVSKRLIAAHIGVTAETLSRSFRELSDAGLISVRGKTVLLLKKLVSAGADAFFEREDSNRTEVGQRRRRDVWPSRPDVTQAAPAWN